MNYGSTAVEPYRNYPNKTIPVNSIHLYKISGFSGQDNPPQSAFVRNLHYQRNVQPFLFLNHHLP